MRPALAIGFLLCLTCGCAPALKVYPWQNEQAAAATLASRARSIHSARATGTLVLTSADNQHVTLDAAIVARSGGPSQPDQAWLRLRTWKFGQAIFDLTAKPEGIWIASDSGQGEGPKAQDRLRSLKPQNISQAWNLFFGDFFSRPGLSAGDGPGPTLTLERREEGITIACDIDKATLTARQYRMTDGQGRVRQTLTLARYQEVGEPPTPWPMLIIAKGDEGQVQLRFDEVEINPELEDSVFTPPRRAVKQP